MAQKKTVSRLPKTLTTVTPLSRIIALAMFIIVAVGAFYLGIYYQQQTRAGFPNFACKQWDTVCDPNYAEPNGYCAVKRICIDPKPTPTPATQSPSY